MAIFEEGRLDEARSIIARYPEGRQRSAVMPLLYLAQSVEGHVTRAALREVADLIGVRTAEVEAVASFYTMLRLRPTGTHLIAVCTNLSCALRGAGQVYEQAHRATGIAHGDDVSEDGLFSVHEEECLGVCERAPVVQVNVANHDLVTPERMAEIVVALRAGEVPDPARGPATESFRAASRSLAGLDPKQTEPAAGSPASGATV
ncbi:MAG: NADH-quinone oxidoreductase subunit NuoE [Actinomycetota bacterium]|nr:NADH-quinone oxidoreductase subunit NuoE [Actinomycetota bacterium]MDH5223539.1 NADH-quinone oxidoreductase subunit NuoE [Actinomycetota bacterium]MDH5313773.1 NADH-quinone oxidoreductase subunit NuoE [Actinomycetota bacterium]